MKEEIKGRGLAWYTHHRDHVNRLRKITSLSYEPTKEDMRQPALWKAAHWNWFFAFIKEDTTKQTETWFEINKDFLNFKSN